MPIPKIIHQTWKSSELPVQFLPFQQKLKDLHPDWQYILWTDDDIDQFVRKEFPDFYPVFASFSKHIMRVDVIRYLLMYKMGGLYLDMDYEFIKPFDLNQYEMVLPKNRTIKFGDKFDGLGNAVFASAPGYSFWLDAINDLKNNPPIVDHFLEVLATTGPAFLTRVFEEHNGNYPNALITERLVFHPPTPKNKEQYENILNNGISYGIHHCYGSWGERWSWNHVKMKVTKFFKGK